MGGRYETVVNSRPHGRWLCGGNAVFWPYRDSNPNWGEAVPLTGDTGRGN